MYDPKSQKREAMREHSTPMGWRLIGFGTDMDGARRRCKEVLTGVRAPRRSRIVNIIFTFCNKRFGIIAIN